MLKSILVAITLTAYAVTPAFAQYAGATTGDKGGNFTYKSKINYVPVTPSAETLEDHSGEQGSGWGDAGGQGQEHRTLQQGFKDSNSDYGPDMRPGGIGSYGARSAQSGNPIAGGGSGAAQGGPIIMFGQNTMLAPANMALRTQYSGKFGGFKLPETKLDSFVYKSGYNFHIYGDEGTYGPPPLTNFEHINDGVNSSGLTTGHKSDAPSAWDTPLKYNSYGGVIQGQ
jgi:hypothetical protein